MANQVACCPAVLASGCFRICCLVVEGQSAEFLLLCTWKRTASVQQTNQVILAKLRFQQFCVILLAIFAHNNRL